VLVSGGVGVAPAWSATPTLTSLTLSTPLAIGSGGTGANLSPFVIGDLPYASSTSALAKLAAVAVGSVLVSGGAGVAPAWSASPTLTGLSLTTLTMSGAITQQRPNDNSAQILMQSTVPPQGRTHEAPFMWYQSGAAFTAGEWDPVMYLGYNADRAVTTEPACRWVIEGNYSHGTRDVEFYWEYLDRSDLSGATAWRPIFITADKDSLLNKSLTLSQTTLTVEGYTVGPLTVNFRPKNANQPVYLSVLGGNGTSTNTSNVLLVTGGSDETQGASLLVQGNSSTSALASANKGVAMLTGGNVTSPTGIQGTVIARTGATPTERIRVQVDGNIAVSKVGVNATALLHLGPGIATAGFGPLKFTSGTNLTTAEPGAMEYDGTNLFFTRTGTTREGVLSASAVTVEAAAQTRTVTININGTTYKLLAA
jgi:hypothetical protein